MNFRLPLAFMTMCMSVAALTACGSSDGPETTPSASASQSGTDAESDEGRYNAALSRFSQFEEKNQPYLARPRRDAAAEQLYTEYWVDPTYQLKVLAALEKAKVRSTGDDEVLRSEPQDVASATLTFRQCIDYSKSVTTANGKRLKKAQSGPQWRYITMTRQSSSLPWKIQKLDDNPNEARPCTA